MAALTRRVRQSGDELAEPTEVEPPGGEPSASAEPLSRLQARGAILGVALLWACYGPGVRFLLNLPSQPPPAAIQAVRTTLAALPFLPLLLASAPGPGPVRESQGGADGNSAGPEPRDLPGAAPGPPAPARLRQSPLWSAAPVLLAGAEVGAYAFAGNACQAVGLLSTTASRAGFVMSSIAVLVPAGAAAAGERVAPRVWAACALAAAGALVLGLGGEDAGAGGAVEEAAAGVASAAGGLSLSLPPGVSSGDALVLLAALCYAWATVRLRHHATRQDPARLTGAKMGSIAVYSLLWSGATALQAASAGGSAEAAAGAEAADAWESGLRFYTHLFAGSDLVGWGLLLFLAVGPGALAGLLHVRGMQRLPAAEAQVILAAVPLLSALLAAGLLGETLGPTTLAGGALMVAASLLAGTAASEEEVASHTGRKPAAALGVAAKKRD